MKGTGEKVKINGKPYTLSEKIGAGLEGSVFKIEESENYVIKLINSDSFSPKAIKDSREHLLWLKTTIDERPEIKRKMAYPKALLDDELGYIMLKANDSESLEDFIDVPQGDGEFDPWFKTHSLKKRYQIIVDLFELLREIHIAGLIFTDLSPKNILVSKKSNQIVLIDTDNMRKKTDTFVNAMGTPGYMAPEVCASIPKEECIKNGLDPEQFSVMGKLSPESDIFSAAVIAFKLLTTEDPFVGDALNGGDPDVEEETAHRGLTDYILKQGTENTNSFLFVQKFDSLTTEKIRKLFYRTFVDGKLFPLARPTDEEFYEAFSAATDMMGECEECGYSNIYEDGIEKNCFNPDCDHPLGNKKILRIFLKFLSDSAKTMKSSSFAPEGEFKKEYLLSELLLQKGEPRFLYCRHFQTNENRQKAIGKVTLVGIRDGIAEIILVPGLFDHPQIRDLTTGECTPIPLGADKAQRFSFEGSEIVFGTIRSNDQPMEVVGRIQA
jgi:serine/threonine protein kinase